MCGCIYIYTVYISCLYGNKQNMYIPYYHSVFPFFPDLWKTTANINKKQLYAYQ